MKKHFRTTLAAAGILSLISLAPAQAEIETTDLGSVPVLSTDTAEQLAEAWLFTMGSPWIDQSTNMLNTNLSLASYASVGRSDSRRMLGYFHDGLLVSGTDPDDPSHNLSLFSDATEIIFVFENAFDLARIDTFTHWEGRTRTGQAYQVFVSTDAGENWEPLYTVDFGNVAERGRVIRGISTANAVAGTAMAKGVNAIKFDVDSFDKTSNVSAYAEIAVYAVSK